jgi:hypothetical protein
LAKLSASILATLKLPFACHRNDKRSDKPLMPLRFRRFSSTCKMCPFHAGYSHAAVYGTLIAWPSLSRGHGTKTSAQHNRRASLSVIRQIDRINSNGDDGGWTKRPTLIDWRQPDPASANGIEADGIERRILSSKP